MKNSHRFNRRTFLRGTGVTMALPWMESVTVWGDETKSSEPGSQPPVRLAVFFSGNGFHSREWWAKGQGTDMELGKVLSPLNDFRDRLLFIGGLHNAEAQKGNIHSSQTGNLLSGAPLASGGEISSGTSVDQLVAQHYGRNTKVPSLVLGCEQLVSGYHETNFSMAYGAHISWQNATSPVPMEIYPSLAFDSLFENRGHRRNTSILDRASEQTKDLSRKVSVSDKAKLDEYLTSVREVERRIESLRAARDKADQKFREKGPTAADFKRPENGLPEDIRDHMRLMCDIMALAFQTDKTRVATLLLCRDISGLCYPFLGVRDAHHSASHKDTSEDYEKITRYYVSQLAYLAKRLDAMPEGDGTVLDHSCLIWLSNMWSGSKHDSTKVPLLTVGGLGGTLETGRILDYGDKADDHRKLCSLYLSLMDRMDVRLDQFGDANARLVGI